MITKIISKIHIHPFFYFFLFLSFITGHFRVFSIFTYIIIVHELGHIVGALFYKWKIDKIVLLPFGGLTIFQEKLNRPMKEEFVITLLGPLFQILFCSFIFYPTFLHYHYFLLFFNLLPIFPLDGSKLFNLFCNLFFPFKKSHLYTLYFSLFFIILIGVFLFLKTDFFLLLVFLFLVFKCFQERKNHDAIFNKFLMERYLYSFYFEKEKLLKNLSCESFFRDYRHFIYFNHFYYTEDYILSKRFDNQGFL